ncbi:MAG: HAD family hydrolase [Chloroflexi bacterium]|nr:HAD family hydrolase [Chloroflexota bacterium]
MVRGILFDGFGTLFAGGLSQQPAAMREVCQRFGLPLEADALLKQWQRSMRAVNHLMGPFYTRNGPAPCFQPLRWIYTRTFAHAFAVLGLSGDPGVAASMVLEHYAASEVYPEAREVLAQLQSCYRLGLLSDADHDFLARPLARADLPLEVICTSESLRTYKPHPRAFTLALAALGCSAEVALYVGDSQYADVQGGRGAGLQVAWVNRTGEPRRSEFPAPDHEVTDLTGLLRVLKTTA